MGACAGAAAAAGALVAASSGCSSERLLSQLISAMRTITATTAPITSHFGMVRAGSAASYTSVVLEAKRWPPISARS